MLSPTTSNSIDVLNKIELLNKKYEKKYSDLLLVEPNLTRSIVSFQANKTRSVYRWYKFKEAFSATLVEFLLERYGVKKGPILDPFAGSGTTLFASSAMGLDAEGIELLGIGQLIIKTKKLIENELTDSDIAEVANWQKSLTWNKSKTTKDILELSITRGAYPLDTANAIGKFLGAIQNETENVGAILKFALLCVLESISYTRKDGQYLRWDHRSGRRQGTKVFDKGHILNFEEAMTKKLKEIVSDLQSSNTPEDLFHQNEPKGTITLHEGSCLHLLQKLPKSSFQCIMTSPPYCNRYDYTRTYALELALLGVDEENLRALRQDMLSCTVENRAKDLVQLNPGWSHAIEAADKQEILQQILEYLHEQKRLGELNNNGIPRMVRGYFYEMACVIYECSRVMKKGAWMFMINDNVRYAGASIPVDIILSEIAANLGFAIERILVLPQGKGNSSQQMGIHGRDALRKCVYVWRRS